MQKSTSLFPPAFSICYKSWVGPWDEARGQLCCGCLYSHDVCILFQVATVKYRHWLSALYQFSQAQCFLLSSKQRGPDTTSDLISALCRTSAIIYDSMMLVKVISACTTLPHYSNPILGLLYNTLYPRSSF